MADTGLEKDLTPRDPAGAVLSTANDEPLDVDNEEKDFIEISAHRPSSSHGSSEKDLDDSEKRPAIDRSKSYATTASAVTRTDSNVDAPPKKKRWYKNLNPLKWGGVPPVPEARGASREYNAPFLSLVYFQWIAPIMSVRAPRHPTFCIPADIHRLATNGRLSKMISGRSIPIEAPRS